MKTIHSPAYHSLLKWLRARRMEKGLTMRQLGEQLGMPHSWVGKVEIGERRLDVEEYVRLCHVLEIEPGQGTALVRAVLFPVLYQQALPRRGLRAAEPKSAYRVPRRKA
jgi:transcriptional regulator with XRE-family HTH domain